MSILSIQTTCPPRATLWAGLGPVTAARWRSGRLVPSWNRHANGMTRLGCHARDTIGLKPDKAGKSFQITWRTGPCWPDARRYAWPPPSGRNLIDSGIGGRRSSSGRRPGRVHRLACDRWLRDRAAPRSDRAAPRTDRRASRSGHSSTWEVQAGPRCAAPDKGAAPGTGAAPERAVRSNLIRSMRCVRLVNFRRVRY